MDEPIPRAGTETQMWGMDVRTWRGGGNKGRGRRIGRLGSTYIHSVQFSSAAQLCPTLCDPMDYSTGTEGKERTKKEAGNSRLVGGS